MIPTDERRLHLAIVDDLGKVVDEIQIQKVPTKDSYKILGNNEGFRPIMIRYLDWVRENEPDEGWKNAACELERHNVEYILSQYDRKSYKPAFYVG